MVLLIVIWISQYPLTINTCPQTDMIWTTTQLGLSFQVTFGYVKLTAKKKTNQHSPLVSCLALCSTSYLFIKSPVILQPAVLHIPAIHRQLLHRSVFLFPVILVFQLVPRAGNVWLCLHILVGRAESQYTCVTIHSSLGALATSQEYRVHLQCLKK